jgi:hypothetical protein
MGARWTCFADYLGRAEAADLCTESWYNLDYALAEMWDGHLQRSTTLVTGASCCDFRFCRQQSAVDHGRSERAPDRQVGAERSVRLG